MKQKTESKIQQEIFIYQHNQYPKQIIHSVPNGFGVSLPDSVPKTFHGIIKKAIAMAVNLCKSTGMLPGVSDLIIHLPGGRCVMVEVKNATNSQDPDQIKIQNKMQDMGGNYILVRSLEDFKEQMKQFNL